MRSELNTQTCCWEVIYSLCISAPSVNVIVLPLSHLLSFFFFYFLEMANIQYLIFGHSEATKTTGSIYGTRVLHVAAERRVNYLRGKTWGPCNYFRHNRRPRALTSSWSKSAAQHGASSPCRAPSSAGSFNGTPAWKQLLARCPDVHTADKALQTIT